MITIRDVARHASVSVATVSRVINNTGHVSETLSGRVRQSIIDLGFEPDFLARTWRTRVTHTIAVVMSDNTSPHHGLILREATSVALAHNYNLILCITFNDPETEHRHLHMLRQRRIDGIILNSIAACDEQIRVLTAAGVPVTLLNRPLAGHGPLVDAVVIDSYRGSYDLVDHLIENGHRRIAMMYGSLHPYHREERLRGYCDALSAHGIAYDSTLIHRVTEYSSEAMEAHVQQILALSPRPTALYAASYNSALAGLRILRMHNVTIPEDIAFAMFDDVTWGDLIDPPLTLVRNPAKEMGRVAMELLFSRMADRNCPGQEVVLQPEVVVRRSSGWIGGAGVAATTCGRYGITCDASIGWDVRRSELGAAFFVVRED